MSDIQCCHQIKVLTGQIPGPKGDVTEEAKETLEATKEQAQIIENKKNEAVTQIDAYTEQSYLNAKSVNIRQFQNFENMKTGQNYTDDLLIATQGFNERGDSGNAQYYVMPEDSEEEADGYSVIDVRERISGAKVGSAKVGSARTTVYKNRKIGLIVTHYINAKWFGAKGDGATDNTDSINRITDFLLKNIDKNGYYGNTYSVYFPKGIYKINSTVKILYSVANWYFDGAILDATDINGDAVTIINTTEIKGELNYSINGLRIVGNSDNTNGIQFGEDNNNDMHAIIFKNLSIKGCNKALNMDKSNSYLITFYDTALDGNKLCINISNSTNAGEKITFINSVLANSDTCVITENGNSDLYFINCSVDYNKVACIAKAGSQVSFIDCHIEWSNKEQEHMQIYGSSAIYIRGGYIICQGTDTYTTPVFKVERDAGVGLTIDGAFIHNLKAPSLVGNNAIVRLSNINSFKFGEFPFKTPNFYTFSSTDKALPSFIEINNEYTIEDGYISITKTNNVIIKFYTKARNHNNFKNTYSIQSTGELPSGCSVWSASFFAIKLNSDGTWKKLYTQGEGNIATKINNVVGDYYTDKSYLWRENNISEEDYLIDDLYAVQQILINGLPDDRVTIKLKDLKIEGW